MLLFFKARKNLTVKIFIIDVCLFSVWVILDVLTWAANSVDIVLFFWGLTILIEVLTYATAFYFSYVFINRKDMPFGLKIFSLLLILPVVIYLPTHFLLPGVDVATCNANENPLINLPFSYGVETVFSMMIVFTAFKGAMKKTAQEKKQIFIFLFGILVFLIVFSSGNIIGSITDDWNLAQYGLFGMPVFIGLLTYLVVRFKTFNVKTFGAQVLVFALAILIGAEFFFVTTFSNQILVGITFILSCIGGFLLVKSVQSEIKAKEDLEIANSGQENLIHVMNHQIKGYLTKDRNIFNELTTEPSYGCSPSGPAQAMLAAGFESATHGIEFVQDILRGESARKGVLQYDMKPIDFAKVVDDVAATQKKTAETKGLAFELKTEPGDYSMTGDAIHLSEAVRNLIDNSINYTISGSIAVDLKKVANKIIFSVRDTGIGITTEDRQKLFTQGGRGKDSQKINVNSTGYGLVFVKAVVEAHKGSVRADSAGAGKGSTFTMELRARPDLNR